MKQFFDRQTMARLSALELRARSMVEGVLAGLHASPFRGHSLEFAQHREYAYGDELRHIDWKVYGRSDRFFVKQFQDETNLRAYLLLDASGSMSFSSRGTSKLEYGKGMAAALAYLLLRQDDAAGLGVFDTGLRHFLAPHHQLSHLSRICDALERTVAGAETGIAGVLKEFGQHVRRRSLLVVISDLLDEPADVLRALKYFRYRHHEVIVLQVLDRDERDFPYSGESLFVQLEGKRTLSADSDALADEYRRLFGRFLDSCRNGFRQAGIDYHLVTTDTPLEKALSRILSARR